MRREVARASDAWLGIDGNDYDRGGWYISRGSVAWGRSGGLPGARHSVVGSVRSETMIPGTAGSPPQQGMGQCSQPSGQQSSPSDGASSGPVGAWSSQQSSAWQPTGSVADASEGAPAGEAGTAAAGDPARTYAATRSNGRSRCMYRYTGSLSPQGWECRPIIQTSVGIIGEVGRNLKGRPPSHESRPMSKPTPLPQHSRNPIGIGCRFRTRTGRPERFPDTR